MIEVIVQPFNPSKGNGQMELLLSTLLGFISGFLTSWLFLKWQLSVKPNIEVSKFAIYNNQENCFRVKVANKGDRQVVDLQVSFAIMKRIKSNGVYRQVVIRKLSGVLCHSALVSRREAGEPWGLLWARSFRSKPDDEALQLLKESVEGEERRLVLNLQCVDAESGTKIVRRLSYDLKHVVYDMKFGEGLSIV